MFYRGLLSKLLNFAMIIWQNKTENSNTILKEFKTKLFFCFYF